MEVIEQLKGLRTALGMMAGSTPVDELRKQIIRDVLKEDVAYENLSERDKAGCDEAVAGIQEVSGVFDDIVKLKAAMTYKFFKALQLQGFTPAEALAITAAQPLEVKQ
jgi:hypothetical protein